MQIALRGLFHIFLKDAREIINIVETNGQRRLRDVARSLIQQDNGLLNPETVEIIHQRPPRSLLKSAAKVALR